MIKTNCKIFNYKLKLLFILLITFFETYSQNITTSFLVLDENQNEIHDYKIILPAKKSNCIVTNNKIDCNPDSLTKLIQLIKIKKAGFELSSIEYFRKKNQIQVILLKQSTSNESPKSKAVSVDKKIYKIRLVGAENISTNHIKLKYGKEYFTNNEGEVLLDSYLNKLIEVNDFIIDSINESENIKLVYISKPENEEYNNKFKNVTKELDNQKLEIKNASERLNGLIKDLIYQIEHDKNLTAVKKAELEDYLELLIETAKNVDSSYTFSSSKRDSLFIQLHYLLISKDSLNNIQTKQILELKNHNTKIIKEHNTKTLYLLSIIVICLLVAFIFIVLSKRLNKQKKEIGHLYGEIKESIEAAKNIQDAILPTKSFMKEHVSDCSIFYKPKDIVSGDFYWSSINGSKFIVAVADCTGHGVAAAFLTFMANEILNKLVRQENIHSAAEILTRLNKDVLVALNQYGNKRIDSGLDIAICVFNKDTNELDYAGANSSIYFISGETNELLQLKANKQGIGGRQKMENFEFKNTVLKYKKNDSIFLFSDGFAGQLGGKSNTEKYMYNRFRSLLTKISTENSEFQEANLKKEMYNWLGSNEQLDDVLVIGIKI